MRKLMKDSARKAMMAKNRRNTTMLIKKREQFAKDAIIAHNEVNRLTEKINNNHHKIYHIIGDAVGNIDNKKTSKYAGRYSDMTT